MGIQMCRDRGYDITIATASCLPDFVRSVLQDQYGFTDAFFETKCWNFCKGYKQHSFYNILGCLGQDVNDDNYKCMVLFDDNDDNIKATDDTGVNFVKVVDKKKGITVDNFW